MPPRTATLIGLTAILMWSLLAALTVATGKIPAFQLAAMTFAVGALAGFLTWIGRPAAAGALRQSPLAWAVGVGGLFGYHALYFLALRFAPPAEAGLLNYLWPLLIVMFSSLLPRERLSRRFKAVPTDAVAGFCLATALLAALVHSLVEVTVWPQTVTQWLAIVGLGVGPVGAAF